MNVATQRSVATSVTAVLFQRCKCELEWVKECIREADMMGAGNSFKNVDYSGEKRSQS